MITSKYKLRYLPTFYDDMEKILTYILENFYNKFAAHRFIDELEMAILERSKCAEATEKYHSIKDRKNPYYRIRVKNFVVFYVVLGDKYPKVMEVRRIIYSRRNIRKII